MERQSSEALVLRVDGTTRDALRWIVGEFLDEVVVAVSWTDALTIAQRTQLRLAVLDLDGLNAPGRRCSSMCSACERIDEPAVGALAALPNAAVVGVGLGVLKPISPSSLIGQIEQAMAD